MQHSIMTTVNQEDNTLVVFVRMPIVSEEHLFRVCEILTFPVPIIVPGQDRKDALQITGLPQQVALSFSQRYYIPMHFMNWAGCYGENILLCKDIPYMKKVSDDTCMGALLKSNYYVELFHMVSFTYPSNLLLYNHFTNLLTIIVIQILIFAYFIPLIVILISVLTNITLILILGFLTNHKISLSELQGPTS